MLLESVSVGDQVFCCLGEGIQYSPPKDPIDSISFNSYFVSGSYPIPEKAHMQVEIDGTFTEENFCGDQHSEFSQTETDCTGPGNMVDAEKYSVTGSLNTCAHTEASLYSPQPTPKRSPQTAQPKKSDINSEWMKLELSTCSSSRGRAGSQGGETEIFLNSLNSSELAIERLASLALKIVDRKGFILENEWNCLSQFDQTVLKVYIENVYGLQFQSTDSLSLLSQLNNLISFVPKGKRNEERLKKTVKKVNSMITKSFAKINNLNNVGEEQLSDILFSAYFGEDASQAFVNVFADSSSLSQKTFSKIVENKRYADDFMTLLRTSYLQEVIKQRQDKVIKILTQIKKKVLLNEDLGGVSLTDIFKQPPWPMSDILDGAKLCYSIIERIQL